MTQSSGETAMFLQANSRSRSRQSGQALTEFALMLPILMLLGYATVHLCNWVSLQHTVFEASRYTAFAAAKTKLSGYGPAGHSATAEQGLRTVERQAQTLYEDFDSANDGSVLAQPMALDRTLVSLRVTNHPIPVVPSKSIEEVASALGLSNPLLTFALQIVLGGLNGLVLNKMEDLGMQTDAQVEARISVAVRNKLVPSHLLPPLLRAHFAAPTTLTAAVSVIGESWALDDGRDVRTPGYIGYHRNDPSEESDLRRIVKKMAGINSVAPSAITNALNQMSSGLSVVFGGDTLTPLDARVASLNYDHSSQHRGRSLPFDDAYEFNGVAGEQRSFETNHFTETRQPRPNVEALQTRGPYFMGCKRAAMRRCEFTTQ